MIGFCQGPMYVLEFSLGSSVEEISWILQKLTDKKTNGGAELLIRCAMPSANRGLLALIGITEESLLSCASQLPLWKIDLKGNLREFSADLMKEFVEIDRDISIFSSADVLTVIRYEIDNLRAIKGERVPGGRKIKLRQGQSIIGKCLHKGMITSLYPLHEPEDLKRLGHEWYGKSLFHQPLEGIQRYFGDKIAYYFAFLHFFTLALIFPTTLGIIHQLNSPLTFSGNLFFYLLYLIWAFLFLELWKRKSNELSYLWGTNCMNSTSSEPRANYRGTWEVNPVTHQMEPHYPRWKTLFKLYFISLPLVVLCMAAAFWMMLISFWAEDLFKQWTISWQDCYVWNWIAQIIIQLPSVIYAAAVWIANHFYRKLSAKLTEWENHRTESQFERNQVTKLILFEFVNNFLCLFYIGFYLQDIPLLRSQVALMLIVFQTINHFTETVWPYIAKKRTVKKIKEETLVNEELTAALSSLKCDVLEATDPIVEQALKESQMEIYIGTHEDYLELFIQFGYLLLFMVTYPMASLWACINNILELQADAWKLGRVFRRPPVIRARHIGAWQPAFQMLCFLAVITNSALVFIISEMNDEETSSWSRAAICLSLEHILLFVQSLLNIIIPSVPSWIQTAKAKKLLL